MSNSEHFRRSQPPDKHLKVLLECALPALTDLQCTCLLLERWFRFSIPEISQLLDLGHTAIEETLRSARSVAEYLIWNGKKGGFWNNSDRELPHYLAPIHQVAQLCLANDIDDQPPIYFARLLVLLRQFGPTKHNANYARDIPAPSAKANYCAVDLITCRSDIHCILQATVEHPWLWNKGPAVHSFISRGASLPHGRPEAIQLLTTDDRAQDLVHQLVETTRFAYEQGPVASTFLCLVAEKFVPRNKLSQKLWDIQRSDGERFFTDLTSFFKIYYDLSAPDGKPAKKPAAIISEIIEIRCQHLAQNRYPGMPMYQESVQIHIDWLRCR